MTLAHINKRVAASALTGTPERHNQVSRSPRDSGPKGAGRLSDWMTTAEVAAASGINSVSVRRYAWRGVIPQPERVGGILLWNRAEIEAWLRNRRRPGRPRKDNPGN
jgi:predicted DNA-binding transcriptional regulator AlpA